MRGEQGSTLIVVVSIIAGVIVFVSILLFACPKGQSVWQDGCVVDLQPEIAKPVQPSDEVPPSEKMPSYERPGVTLATAASTADDDAKADAEKVQADTEGKKAAHIPVKGAMQ